MHIAVQVYCVVTAVTGVTSMTLSFASPCETSRIIQQEAHVLSPSYSEVAGA